MIRGQGRGSSLSDRAGGGARAKSGPVCGNCRDWVHPSRPAWYSSRQLSHPSPGAAPARQSALDSRWQKG